MRTIFEGDLAPDTKALHMMWKDWSDERERVDNEGRGKTCNRIDDIH